MGSSLMRRAKNTASFMISRRSFCRGVGLLFVFRFFGGRERTILSLYFLTTSPAPIAVTSNRSWFALNLAIRLMTVIKMSFKWLGSLISPDAYPILTQYLPNTYPILTQYLPNTYPILTQCLPNTYPILTQYLPNAYPCFPIP